MHPEGAWGVGNASRMRLGPVATTYGHFFENRKNRKKFDFFDFEQLILVRILAKNGGQSEIPKLKNRFFENEALNQKSETVNRKLCPWSIQNSLGDGRDHELAMPPHFETTPQNVVFRGSG